MKHFEKMIFAGTLLVGLGLGSGTAIADQQPKPIVNSKRPANKPTIWQRWGNEMRSFVQEQIHLSQYIRGNSPPEYNR